MKPRFESRNIAKRLRLKINLKNRRNFLGYKLDCELLDLYHTQDWSEKEPKYREYLRKTGISDLKI